MDTSTFAVIVGVIEIIIGVPLILFPDINQSIK
jgi:hypothetical protein